LTSAEDDKSYLLFVITLNLKCMARDSANRSVAELMMPTLLAKYILCKILVSDSVLRKDFFQ